MRPYYKGDPALFANRTGGENVFTSLASCMLASYLIHAGHI